MLAVAAPGLLAFSWTSLIFAHYWSRFRHGGGGLPWVLGILWSSTWVLVGNTTIYLVGRGLAGGPWPALALSWKPLLQQGLAATYVALLIGDVGQALGWWRLAPAWWAGRLLPLGGRQLKVGLGSLLLMGLGLALAAPLGLAAANLI